MEVDDDDGLANPGAPPVITGGIFTNGAYKIGI